MRKRDRERRLKLRREQQRERQRRYRLRRGALLGAEAMLRLATERLLGAAEPDLLAHAQVVHQAVREKALDRRRRLARPRA